MGRGGDLVTDTIRGVLRSFVVRGADYWGTGTVETKHDGGRVAIVGKVLGAKEGDTVEIEGDFTRHERFGPQFKIKSCRVVLPMDVSGVVGWLASKLPQISRRRAEALVQEHEVEGLWDILDRGDIDTLTQTGGITPARAEAIVEAYRESKGDRDRMVLFKSWGLTDNQIGRVLEKWGDDAVDAIKRDPYLLLEQVSGFGWKRADEVARAMGVKLDDPSRLAAGLMHAMTMASTEGHCYCAGGKLVSLVANKVCGVQDEGKIRAALEKLIERKKLVRHGVNVYLKGIAESEELLAEAFAQRAADALKGAA